MKLKFLLNLTFIFLLIGCANQQENTLVVKVEKLNSADIADYATSIEYLKLDDSILLKAPRKIIQFSSQLFIQNREKTHLLIYDMNGNLLDLIQKEPLIGLKSIWDFSIDKVQNFIYVYDVGSLSIFKFDMGLNFHSKISIPIVPKDFFVTNGKFYLVHNANDFYKGTQLLDGLYEYIPETEEFLLLSSAPETEASAAPTNMISQISSTAFQFFWMYDDSVRTIRNGKLSVDYVLNKEDVFDLDDPRFSKIYKFLPASTKNYDSFYRFNSDKLLNHVFVDKNSGEVIEINPEFWTNSIDYAPVPTIISSTENGEFIGIMESEALFSMKDKYLNDMEDNNSTDTQAYELLKNLSSDDNMILAFIKLK